MTQISISNIAWDTRYDTQVAELMEKHSVSFVDIAPSKYIDISSLNFLSEAKAVREHWLSRGIHPLGMQSLLFGTKGLNVFGDVDTQARMLSHLERVCAIGDVLNARRLVFGSPRNRDCTGLSADDVRDRAVTFFRRLGDVAKKYNVIVCLEPNPECYNSNFMTNSIETAEVVEYVEHDNIKMQLDTGAMCINQEQQEETLLRVKDYVAHIHISEPNLVPVCEQGEYQASLAPLIKKHFPKMPITIEMLTKDDNSALSDIEKSLKYVKALYQG